MHQGLPLPGYMPQNEATLAIVRQNKAAEELVLRIVDTLQDRNDVDKRWLAVARTHIEQGFMAMNRSLLKPARLTDKELEATGVKTTTSAP